MYPSALSLCDANNSNPHPSIEEGFEMLAADKHRNRRPF
jgi:hypothetical protein